MNQKMRKSKNFVEPVELPFETTARGSAQPLLDRSSHARLPRSGQNDDAAWQRLHGSTKQSMHLADKIVELVKMKGAGDHALA